MAGKRKREGSVDSTTQTTVSPSSTERIKRRRSSSKLSNETEGVNVVWELADGSRRIERQLGEQLFCDKITIAVHMVLGTGADVR